MPIDRSTPPAITDFPPFGFSFPEATLLPNGIMLYAIGGENEEVCRLTLLTGGGKLDQQFPMQAQLAAELTLEGTADLTAEQLAEKFDYFGAWKSVQANAENTEFNISALTANVDRVVPLIVDCLRRPAMPAGRLELSKRSLASQLATQEQQVKYRALQEIKRLLYGDRNPLAAKAEPDQVLAVGTDSLLPFHRRHCIPAGAVAILAGHLDDRLIATFERELSAWDCDLSTPPPAPWQTQAPDCRQTHVDMAHTVQTAIMMALPAPRQDHPDHLKFKVLETVLGGYFGSRLNKNIREEKGLTYGIRANIIGCRHQSNLLISTECHAQATEQVIEQIKLELRRLCEEPIPDDELTTVKQYIISCLAAVLDTPFSIADHIGQVVTGHLSHNRFNDKLRTYSDVTAAELQSLARRYFLPEKLLIATAGKQC